MSTQDKYYDEGLALQMPGYEAEKAKRRQAADSEIEQIVAAIDQSAQAGVAGYQQSMEQAPLDALEQKEDNALREAINRKIVSENMANMGLTDSGLNRTQQTALTLQRGNADAAVDQKTQEYVRNLQFAIDEVMSNAEAQKAENKINIEKEYSDWDTAAYSTLQSNAMNYASNKYAAEQERLAAVETAQIEAAQKQNDTIQQYIANRMADGVSYDMAKTEAAAVYGNDENARTYITNFQKAINAGYDESQAAIIATNMADGKDWDTGVASAAAAELGNLNVNDLVSLEDGLNFGGKYRLLQEQTTPYGWLFTPKSTEEKVLNQTKGWDDDDWNGVVGRMVTKASENLNTTGRSLSDTAKQYAVGKAVGAALKTAKTPANGYGIYAAIYDNLSGVAANAAFAAAGINAGDFQAQ